MSAATATPATASDRTNYYEIVPARYLETMLWTHAERMARPVIDPQVFETERNVVKEEFRQRVLAPPYGRLRLLITDNAWDVSPHRRPTIGSIEQLDAATIEDARAFHEAYYGPDTATLIVSGNFDQKQLDSWVDKYFARDPARAPADCRSRSRRARSAAHQRRAARPLYAPNVPLPVVGSIWRIPGSGASRHGRARGARRDPHHRRELAASQERWSAPEHRHRRRAPSSLAFEEGGYLAPNAILAGGRTVEEAEAALAAEIERVRSQPVTAAELAEAKNELLAQALRQRETFSGRAFGLGEVLVRSGDPEAVGQAARRLAAGDRRRRPARRPDLAGAAKRGSTFAISTKAPGRRPAGRLDQPGADAALQIGAAGDPPAQRARGRGRARGAAGARRRGSRSLRPQSPKPGFRPASHSSPRAAARCRWRR